MLVDLAVGRSLVVEEKAGLAKRWHALLCTWAGRLWTEADCLPGWRGLGGRSLLGSESRMTKWDAGKLALEGQVKGTRTRF